MMIAQPNAMVNAAGWIDGLIGGGLALALATVGVAGVGLAMLSGRIDVRRGLGVIFGCFLILGAPTIARGIMRVGDPQSAALPAQQVTQPPPSAPEAKKVQTAEDPYAGASLVR